MSLLEQIIREQIKQRLNEAGEARMSVHPFANHLANQRDTTPQENLYDDIVNATLIKMVSAHTDEQVRGIIRELADSYSTGPAGVGGRFSDAQVEEIQDLVYDKIEQKLDVNLRSHLPQDREHPLFVSEE